MTILIATVGGSTDPVVHAIRQTRPSQLGFIASRKGDGTMVGSDVEIPKILGELRWNGPAPLIETTDRPDDLGAIWEVCVRLHDRLPSDARVIANYTGGSKSMSAALVSFALRRGWELQLQVARRTDLIRVTAHDAARKVAVGAIIAHDVRQQARMLAERHDNEGAALLLEGMLAAHALEGALQDVVQDEIAGYRFEEALEAYDFERAAALLTNKATSLGRKHGADWVPKLGRFRRTLAWLAAKDEPPPVRIGDALELVDFLVETAIRSANRGRFDDGFSRLYRATELLAQVVLRHTFELSTADVDRARLPPDFGVELALGRDGKLKAGLTQSYEILSSLDHRVGRHYTDNPSRLLHLLENRNESWLAHGFRSITPSLWRAHGEPWITWLREAVAHAR